MKIKAFVRENLPNSKIIVSSPKLPVDNDTLFLMLKYLAKNIMELKINVANNNNINCTHLATKGFHLNLVITKFFNDVKRLRVTTRENPSM